MASVSTVEAEIKISRPLPEVFDFSVAVDRWREWQVRFAEVEQTSPGPFGTGTTLRTVSEAVGKRFESRSEVTEFVPNQLIVFEGRSEVTTFASRWSFDEPATGTTRLVVKLESTTRDGAVLAKLARPWLTRVFRKRLEADLEAMKMVLEAQD